MNYQETIKNCKYYTVDNMDSALNTFKDIRDHDNKLWVKKSQKGKSKKEPIYYLNKAMAFDIETSSFYNYGIKCACMYIWMFAIDDICIIGRTWDEFELLNIRLSQLLGADYNHRLVIYVHNLAFDSEFFLPHLNVTDVFALKEHKPCYALTTDGIEYRCSYMLSGLALSTLADGLLDNPLPKLKMDYSLIRGPKTELSKLELQYCISDVMILTSYINEQIRKDGNITKIPLTKTGYVRNYCRTYCLKDIGYRKRVQNLKMTESEYYLCKDAFMGGYTHTSFMHRGEIMINPETWSFDISSSYPTVLVSEEYPMSSGQKLEIDSLERLYTVMKYYIVIGRCRITGLRPKVDYDHYLSLSKCKNVSADVETDNGRIISASFLDTAFSSPDLEIMDACYDWDSIEFYDCVQYKKGYLPKKFIECVIYFYTLKTKLKDVKNGELPPEHELYEMCHNHEEEYYQKAKANFNSLYGMIAYDECRDQITYDGEYHSEESSVPKMLEKYNSTGYSNNRFLHYPWACLVTAYARRNLWKFISVCGGNGDFVYSDTDSVKLINGSRYLDWVNEYNKEIVEKIQKCLSFHNLPLDSFSQKNVYGKVKQMGIFELENEKDDDGNILGYKYFKALRAKAYIYKAIEKNKKTGKYEEVWHLTCAGTDKKLTMEYLIKKYKTDRGILIHFDNNLIVPPEYSGKLTHSYCDSGCRGTIVDCQGNEFEYDEKAYVHLEPVGFEIHEDVQSVQYLMGIWHDH